MTIVVGMTWLFVLVLLSVSPILEVSVTSRNRRRFVLDLLARGSLLIVVEIGSAKRCGVYRCSIGKIEFFGFDCGGETTNRHLHGVEFT